MIETTRAALALSLLPRVGRTRLRRLLARFSWTESACISSLPEVLERAGGHPFSTIDLNRALVRADSVLAACRRLGLAIHAFGSPSYPIQLERLASPPALLFSKGRFDPNHRPRVAVVGTRTPTSWGTRSAGTYAGLIADWGGVVVSGLARGIDTAAHAASLGHSGPTWAVLAHGLHMVSPESNRDLASQIVLRGGALISEYPPDAGPRPRYFVERDRIQAGLAEAVLVIETDCDGGAMHTARFARRAGVPVWVTLPNRTTKVRRLRDLPEAQQGTWELLRTRAAIRVAGETAFENLVRDLGSLPRRSRESA
jgi:DNA processing protein